MGRQYMSRTYSVVEPKVGQYEQSAEMETRFPCKVMAPHGNGSDLRHELKFRAATVCDWVAREL